MVLSVQQAYLSQIPTWACDCEQLVTSQWVGAWHLGVRSVDSGRADRCLSGRWRTDKSSEVEQWRGHRGCRQHLSGHRVSAAGRHEDLSVAGEAGQGKAEEFEALAVVSLMVMGGGAGGPG